MNQSPPEIKKSTQRGRLVIISGPSGSGKSSLVERLLAALDDRLVESISATTRRPRPGEVDGRDYFFLTPEEFERRRLAGEFLECVEVFGAGHWYGTPNSQVGPSLAAGKWVVLEIDVQGALDVMRQFPDAVTIFVDPGSPEILEERLRGRRTEDEEAILRRLEVARRELSQASLYKHRVVNDHIDRAVSEIQDIIRHSEGWT